MQHALTSGILNIWMGPSTKSLRGFGQDPAAATTTPPDQDPRVKQCADSGGTYNAATSTCEVELGARLGGVATLAKAIGSMAIIGGFVWYVSRKG